MNILHLKYAVSIAECGSINKAAVDQYGRRVILFLPLGKHFPHPGEHIHIIDLPEVFRRHDFADQPL